MMLRHQPTSELKQSEIIKRSIFINFFFSGRFKESFRILDENLFGFFHENRSCDSDVQVATRDHSDASYLHQN